MSKKKAFYLFIFFILFFSCSYKNKTDNRKEFISKNIEKRKLSKDLYNMVCGLQVDRVKEILATGIDPNFCRGECGWVDSNPLSVLTENIDNTSALAMRHKPSPSPIRDVAIFKLLIDANADIKRRPYVWFIVYFYDNDNLSSVEEHRKQENLGSDYINDEVKHFVSDVNRLLDCFLVHGADPDKLGHPYPYSAEAMFAKINDKQANKYFLEGIRPINEAIKKGILWESQVDLLLQYTTLDEDSLKAAKESKDPAMIEKITRLWKEQQGKPDR
jgi:hypothetical protein